MSSAADRKAQRQQSILRAAIRAFSRQGYHGCTVAEVAREAGVADGTIYLYFQGKEDLLVSAFRHVLEGVLERLERELAPLSDPVAKLERLVTLHLEEMEKDPDLATFLQFQLRQPDQNIRKAVSDCLTAYARKIEQVIEEGKAAGRLRSDLGTRAVRRVLFGAIDETVSAWVLRSDKEPLVPKAGPIVEIVLHGIARRG
ncbi:MAG: fatty acid metabolism transcriptional regulator FadR [Deferrisomatales bacterium]